jgi:hypothetical protein
MRKDRIKLRRAARKTDELLRKAEEWNSVDEIRKWREKDNYRYPHSC